MSSVCGMDAGRAQYNVRHYGKHKILLLDTHLLYLYFSPDLVGQYLGTYHNNVTHISTAVSNDVYRYRYTFFPWIWMQRYYKHGNHEVVHHFYRFQRYDLIFLHAFCFMHCDFYLLGVSYNYCAMLKGKNVYFWQI